MLHRTAKEKDDRYMENLRYVENSLYGIKENDLGEFIRRTIDIESVRDESNLMMMHYKYPLKCYDPNLKHDERQHEDYDYRLLEYGFDIANMGQYEIDEMLGHLTFLYRRYQLYMNGIVKKHKTLNDVKRYQPFLVDDFPFAFTKIGQASNMEHPFTLVECTIPYSSNMNDLINRYNIFNISDYVTECYNMTDERYLMEYRGPVAIFTCPEEEEREFINRVVVKEDYIQILEADNAYVKYKYSNKYLRYIDALYHKLNKQTIHAFGLESAWYDKQTKEKYKIKETDCHNMLVKLIFMIKPHVYVSIEE